MEKPIIKHLKNILFFVFVFFIVSYIILETFIPTKTVDILGVKSYVVISSSMEPDIMVNDLIIVRSVSEEDLDIRDKITFYVYIPEIGKKSTVTHYIGDIVEINGVLVYKTQGATKGIGEYDEWVDENNDSIEITYDDIEGRVGLVIPNLGHAVNILKDPISIGLLIVNLFVIYLLIKAFKSKEIEEDKN